MPSDASMKIGLANKPASLMLDHDSQITMWPRHHCYANSQLTRIMAPRCIIESFSIVVIATPFTT